MRKKFLFLCILICCLFVMSFIEDERRVMEETDIARSANQFMWNSFHQGNYDSIPQVLQKLNNAYLQNPKDFKIVAHLGFVHLWAFSERGRKTADSSVLSHVYSSNHFFKEAIKLNPDDPRLRGFQASTEICEGALSEKLFMILKGYIYSLKAIKKWPTFNRTALSLIESQLDSSSALFQQGINNQWKVVDECSCKKLDEKTVMASPKIVLADFFDEVKNSKDPLIKRACWNSWIAPHNMEGFCLNFGDMLVKEGQLKEAKEIYQAAKLSPSYEEWIYKPVIEERIKNMESDTKIFNKPLKIIYRKNEKQIFINSEISCVACHQMSKKEFKESGYQEPPDEIYFIKK